MRQTSTGTKEKRTATQTGPAANWLTVLSRLRRRIAAGPPSNDEPNSPNGVEQSNRSRPDAEGENPLAERSRRRPAKAMAQTRTRSVTP